MQGNRAKIRRASSVIVTRGANDSRVYLARRAPQLRFFGGYWAFVGGGVAPEDATIADRLETSAGPEDPAFAVAAVRELLEELGLDLGTPPLTAADRDALRRDLLNESFAFPDPPRLEGVLSQNLLQPIVRLLTPAYHPIRFDTQFYRLDWSRAELPEPSIWPGELVDGAWREPAEWLDLWRRGEILIAPPVLFILHSAVAFGWDEGLHRLLELEEELGGGRIHVIFCNPAAQLLPVRTPTIPPATHTNVYLVGSDPAYLVDPASPYEDEQDRLISALERSWESGLVPQRRLRAILLTHHHPDHIGAVERCRSHFSVPVWAHAATAAELHGKIAIDRLLGDGDVLPLGVGPDGRAGWELEVILTPGHAAGHLCFFERRYGSLLAGDMISTLSSILVRTSDGDMTEYVRSLQRIAALPVQIVYPAHGPADARGAAVLNDQLEHRRSRESAILAAIERGAHDFDTVVQMVYQDVPEAMHRFAAQSVEAVCAKLAREGRIRLTGSEIGPLGGPTATPE
ncbi:MAG: MBL fold metallo-hydrolase [Candidatus Eisenbacteria bacterium]|uniref:MBL fold metallo-hydrolase n=1 Tax=Eiseniibacteriota bacterium TaxID=2212470 RepID=A0A956LXS6_UNCEI|nr:MBL fold metallo-hydrolase [Candidatus Eisenbacteria bacterium]